MSDESQDRPTASGLDEVAGQGRARGEASRSMPMPTRQSEHSLAPRAARALWGVVWLVLFRPTPRPMHLWRRWLLRLFGARIGPGVLVYGSARFWAPWNLEAGARSCIGPDVDCYCIAPVTLGEGATVSQYTYLCTATHDPDDPTFPLVAAPIRIGPRAWVAADAFVAPGVTVGEGAVVGARASVYKDVEAWTIVGGNPARPIRRRGGGPIESPGSGERRRT